MVVHSSTLRQISMPLATVMPIIGAIAITLATQVRLDLPFTPVPVTGQTFVVLLWGLLFGARQGALAASAYLVAGSLGLPVFAGFTSMPALWGPTAGYLLGFVPAAWIAGLLAERSWTQNVARAFIAALLASLPILIIGTIVLAGFVGWNNVLEMGLYPFLAGDVIKCGAAAVSVAVLNKHKG